MPDASSTRCHVLRAAAFALALGASPVAAQMAPPAPMPVVATFSILGDITARVGGDRISLTTLVGPGGDGHVYSPSPADARRVSEARLLVTNGLGFEGWMGRLQRAAKTKAVVVEAARAVTPIKEAGGQGPGHSHGHSHAHGDLDPHAWQSVPNAKLYVAAIRDALVAADPEGRSIYEANAAAYLTDLDALDAEIRAAVAALPEDRRRVVTTHDAFGYFQREYGIRFISPQGVSTEAEASARDVARIITQVKRDRIPAVFLENVSDARLAKRISDETGARIGGTLYSDALSPAGGNAPTYIALMRHNMRELARALAPSS